MTTTFVSGSEIKPTNYIHGTKPEEQKRLSLLNRILNEKCLKEMNLRGGEKILDVGSGLGQFSRLMARTVGEKGSVLGIERDAEQLNEARRQAIADGEADLVEFRQGDALSFPLFENEWNSFDVAHTRFVLEHIPNPLAVVKAMVKSVRAGGRIILEDDNHDSMRLYPESKEFDALWRAYYQTYEILGNDPLVGNKLVSLLVDAGAKPVRNTWIFFGSCAGDENFKFYIENLLGVIEGAKELIIGANLLDEKNYDAGIKAINEWEKLPDAAIWFSLSFAEGVRLDGDV